VYAKAKETDFASRIRDLINLSDICTYNMAINRLKTIRPEIEIRKTSCPQLEHLPEVTLVRGIRD
jgi:hypothetical protein